jgi:FkbM family methyltransferase
VTQVRRLSKPQYIFRPSQLLRRVIQRGDSAEIVVRTPWGTRMLVAREDTIGAGIARMGVHELAVSEAMWRLAGGDRLALDVGANIGYFTGLLACRAEEVIALEPNPRLHRFISSNIERWGETGSRVRLDPRAASDTAEPALLHLPPEYASNYGVATLEAAEGTTTYEVEGVRLDDVIAAREVGVMKIDVEGHELTALEGAEKSLRGELIRDIFFEEHRPLPSPVSELLAGAGFTILTIGESLLGPTLLAPGEEQRGWEAPTYLATRDETRTRRLLAPRGWRCLRPPRPGILAARMSTNSPDRGR